MEHFAGINLGIDFGCCGLSRYPEIVFPFFIREIYYPGPSPDPEQVVPTMTKKVHLDCLYQKLKATFAFFARAMKSSYIQQRSPLQFLGPQTVVTQLLPSHIG
jgi:hypothetical protein